LTPKAKNIKKFENNCVGPRGVKNKKNCDTELSGLSVKNAKIEKKTFFFVIKNKKRLKKMEAHHLSFFLVVGPNS